MAMLANVPVAEASEYDFQLQPLALLLVQVETK